VTRKRDEKPYFGPPAPSEQNDDEQALQEFCSAVHYEEMSFENWCQKHKKLDLEIPIFVTGTQLSATFRAVVKFSRTIRTHSAQGHQEKREKIEREVVLEPSTDCPRAIKLKGLGDVEGDQAGDLWIIIKIKE
jgi:hypothetical protein